MSMFLINDEYLKIGIKISHKNHVVVVLLWRIRILGDGIVGQAHVEIILMRLVTVIVVRAKPYVKLVILPDFEGLEGRHHDQLANVKLVSGDYSSVVDQEGILDVLLADEVGIARADVVHDVAEVVRYVDTAASR